jgi:hypothetical protein
VPENTSKLLALIILAIGAAYLPFCVCRPIDPSVELARTTREAVEFARDAQSGTLAAVLWTGRFRLLAIALGVSGPMIVVLLLWRWSARSEIEAVEVFQIMEQHGLPHAAPPALPPATDAGQPDKLEQPADRWLV